jgi:hypothetical protein
LRSFAVLRRLRLRLRASGSLRMTDQVLDRNSRPSENSGAALHIRV